MLPLNRRQLLTALGLGGAAAVAGFPHRVRADSEAPKRLVLFSTGHGMAYDAWKLRPGSKGEDTPWTVDLSTLSKSELSTTLAPLYAHRSRLIVPDGISMTSAAMDMAGYRHEKGWLHAWTGAWVYFTGDDLYATEPSLDQLVAAEIQRTDRLPSLELSVEAGRPISHAGLAQPLPHEPTPTQVYERLFGRMLGSNPLQSSQGRALDLARAEYTAMEAQLGASDRALLQTHFDMVRDLETRFAGMASAACDPPSKELFSGARNYNADFEAMAELIRVALSCDLTRVVSLSMGDIPAADFGWSSYLSGDVHFDFAHRIYEDENAMQAMIDYNVFHAHQLAFFLDLLASTPDVDGRTLLDNTLVVWGNELGDGWHGYHRYCPLLVGGDWYFRPGQYHHWPTGNTPLPMLVPDGESNSGIPHHHLLVSIARAMGLDRDHVGLSEAYTAAGERLDFTGELEDLRA